MGVLVALGLLCPLAAEARVTGDVIGLPDDAVKGTCCLPMMPAMDGLCCEILGLKTTCGGSTSAQTAREKTLGRSWDE